MTIPKIPVEWCEHFKRCLGVGYGIDWFFLEDGQGSMGRGVSRSWKYCPICGKERPKWERSYLADTLAGIYGNEAAIDWYDVEKTVERYFEDSFKKEKNHLDKKS